MGIALHQVVTFAAQAFAGNPAMVLVSDHPLSSDNLQRIAGQMREPVLASIATLGEQLRLTFTTPNGPHPGAGHAAHAAAHVALSTLRPNADRFEFTLDNDRRMAVSRAPEGPAVEWPVMPYSATDAVSRVAACIGVVPRETFTAAFGLLAVVDSDRQLAAIVPDFDAISTLAETTLMVTARDSTGDFAIRVFAPKAGLPEDPVCGTAHRIVVPLWADRLGKRQMISRQLSPRGGTLHCRLGDGTVTISGAATLFFSGTIGADLP